MTIQDLLKLPLEPTLQHLVTELNTHKRMSDKADIHFKRDIQVTDNELQVQHSIRVQNQVVFSTVKFFSTQYPEPRASTVEERYKIYLLEADKYFLTNLITYLLIHKLPSVVEMAEYYKWKGLKS